MHALQSLETGFDFFTSILFLLDQSTPLNSHFFYVLLVDVFGFLHIFFAFFGNRAGVGAEQKYDWLWGRIIL